MTKAGESWRCFFSGLLVAAETFLWLLRARLVICHPLALLHPR